MFNSLKKARARSRKRIRKATVTAIGQMSDALLPKPAKVKSGATPGNARRNASKALTPAGAGSKASTRPAKKAIALSATARSRLPIPRGASFRAYRHDCTLGSLEYKLYLPACAGKTLLPLPVVVMLHGCGQTPDDFARGTGMNALADELGFIVVYPAQDRRAQPNRCWNWYRREDQGRATGEPARLASLMRHVLRTVPADPARVYVAGLSAGASMALILAASYPDIFAAVGAHSGLAQGAARDASTAAFAMKHGAPGNRSPRPMPTIVFHGEDDRIVNIRNGRFIVARAADAYAGLRCTERSGHAEGGRKFVRQSYRRGKGRSFIEFWSVAGAGHAWSGGSRAGRFADPAGPDASREMLRFFLQHRTTIKHRKSAELANALMAM